MYDKSPYGFLNLSFIDNFGEKRIARELKGDWKRKTNKTDLEII